jgi:hypothetical protein
MGSFALCKKKASSHEQADLRDVVKKAYKYVCTSLVLVAPDSLSPTASTSSSMKPTENTEEDRHYPNQQMKEIARLNTPLISSAGRV